MGTGKDIARYFVDILLSKGYPQESIRENYRVGHTEYDICILNKMGKIIQIFEMKKSTAGTNSKLEQARNFLLFPLAGQEYTPETYLYVNNGEKDSLFLLTSEGKKELTKDFEYDNALNYWAAIGRIATGIEEKANKTNNITKWVISNWIIAFILMLYLGVYVYIHFAQKCNVPFSFELILFLCLIYLLFFIHKIVPYINRVKLGELEIFLKELDNKSSKG